MSLFFSTDSRFLFDVRKTELLLFDVKSGVKCAHLHGKLIGLSSDETQVIMRLVDGQYGIYNVVDRRALDATYAANFVPHQRLVHDPNYTFNQSSAHFIDVFDPQVHVALNIPNPDPQISQGFKNYKGVLRLPGQPFAILMTWYDTRMFEGSTLRCYDLATGTQCFESVINGNAEPAIFFSKAQHVLMVKEFDCLLFFDMTSFNHLGDLDYLSSATRGYVIQDNRRIMIDTKTRKPVADQHIQAVSMNPDLKSRLIIAVDQEIHHVIVDWNSPNSRRYQSKFWKTEKIVPMKLKIDALTFFPDGKKIAIRLVNGEVLIQDIESQRLHLIQAV